MTDSQTSLLRIICNTFEPVNPSINIDDQDYPILNSWSSSVVSSVRYLQYDGAISVSRVNICDTVIGSAVSTNLMVCAASDVLVEKEEGK